MFSKELLDTYKLPHATETFRQKFMHAHYTLLHWKLSNIPSLILPISDKNRWKWGCRDSSLPPAPELPLVHSVANAAKLG